MNEEQKSSIGEWIRRLPFRIRGKIIESIPPQVEFRFRRWRQEQTFRRNEALRARREELFDAAERKGLENIPLFIISYNRVSYLQRMIPQLEKLGFSRITIIDNHSTYPPLLEYYQSCGHEVIYLDYNGGHKVFWTDERFAEYRKDFYLLSDPDLYLVDECDKHLVEELFRVLRKYPFVNKVGVSLCINDLPENGVFGDSVVKWEKRYYRYQPEKGVYFAPVDTTLGLYIPDEFFVPERKETSFRLDSPYQAKHLPWYRMKGELTEEDIYYSEHKENGWWNVAAGKMTKDKAV